MDTPQSLKGTRLPQKAFMIAFLQACGINGEQLDRWRRAWERVADTRARTQQAPPSFTAVLDEAALHRVTGGPKVMRAQLKRLIEVACLPNVTIRVVPFAIGAHSAVESNFVILKFPTAADIIFAEGLAGSFYIDRPVALDRYRTVFEQLRSLALSPEGTIHMIAVMCT
jgi:hypothetical protein